MKKRLIHKKNTELIYADEGITIHKKSLIAKIWKSLQESHDFADKQKTFQWNYFNRLTVQSSTLTFHHFVAFIVLPKSTGW